MLRLVLGGHWLVQAVQAVLAALCFAAAFLVWQDSGKEEAAKALALQQGVPAAVVLDAFDPARDIHPAGEVHVIGWIDPAHNYRLTEQRKSSDVVRRMFVLFGPADAASSREVRAVLMMSEPQFEAFAESLPELIVDPLAEFPTLRFNGKAEDRPELRGMAEDALAERGLRKAPGFVFIEPWLGGRDKALAPDITSGPIVSGIYALLGAFLALMAVRKMRRGGPVGVQVAEADRLQTAMRMHHAAQGLTPPEPVATPAPVPKRRLPVWPLLVVGGIVALVTVPGLGSYAGLIAPFAMLGIFLLGLRQLKRMAAAGAGALWSRATAAAPGQLAGTTPAAGPARPGPGVAPVQEPAIRSVGGGQPVAKAVLAVGAGLVMLAVAGGWSPAGLSGFTSGPARPVAAPAEAPAAVAQAPAPAEPAAAAAEDRPAPRVAVEEPAPAASPPAFGLPGWLAGALTEIGVAVLVLVLMALSVRRWLRPAAPRFANREVDPFDRLAERLRAGERC